MSASLPKYLQISQAIESQIQNENWETGRIPSVREIAAAHGVSVVTASRALQVLRDKGLINAVERSGCYLVSRTNEEKENWAVVWNVTPGPYKKETELILQSGFERIAKKQNIQLEDNIIDFSGPFTDRELNKSIREAKEKGITGLFFMPSRLDEKSMQHDEQFLKACDAVALPVVLIERNLRGVDRKLDRDLVSSDDVGGGRQLTRHLIEQGRKRIAFVSGSPTSSHLDRMAGYYQVICEAQAQGRVDPPIVLWQNSELPARQTYGILSKELLEKKVDAVVCYQDYTAYGLIVEFFSKGVQVPNDIAVAGFDDLPIGNMFTIGVTTYAFPSESVAQKAVWLMRERNKNPMQEPVKLVVAGKLIERESTLPQQQKQPTSETAEVAS